MTHDVMREGGEMMKEEEEKMKEPEPLAFLATPVTEEDISPKVATTYRKLTRAIAISG
jgi:hypothetical protein